jgi:hypothetical protein
LTNLRNSGKERCEWSLNEYLSSPPEITEKLAFSSIASKPTEIKANKEEQMRTFLAKWNLGEQTQPSDNQEHT